MRSVLLVRTAAASATAFSVHTSPTLARRSCLYMGGAKGVATSPAGKAATVERISSLLESSEMIFSVPSGSMTVAETQLMRESLPEGTVATTVKNTLMARALEGSEFNVLSPKMLKGPNMWFFIEEDIGGTLKAYKAFLKENNKAETHPVQGGVIEGVEYDDKGVEAIGKLPSKLELYAKIAGSIKAVPTKVAKVVKAPNSKLARAIKLATMPEDGDE